MMIWRWLVQRVYGHPGLPLGSKDSYPKTLIRANEALEILYFVNEKFLSRINVELFHTGMTGIDRMPSIRCLD